MASYTEWREEIQDQCLDSVSKAHGLSLQHKAPHLQVMQVLSGEPTRWGQWSDIAIASSCRQLYPVYSPIGWVSTFFSGSGFYCQALIQHLCPSHSQNSSGLILSSAC